MLAGSHLPTFAGAWRKQGSSNKTCTSASLTTLKPLTVWVTTNGGKEMGIQYHLACFLRNLYEGRKATAGNTHRTTDWFKIAKGVCQGCILSPCLFNLYAKYIVWNAGLDESQTGIKIARRNINNLSWHNPYGRKQRTVEPLDESERGERKVGLKLSIQKPKIMASSPITSWQIEGEIMETGRGFILGDSKITADGDCRQEIKRHLLLGRKTMTNLDSILKSTDVTLLTKLWFFQ